LRNTSGLLKIAGTAPAKWTKKTKKGREAGDIRLITGEKRSARKEASNFFGGVWRFPREVDGPRGADVG